MIKYSGKREQKNQNVFTLQKSVSPVNKMQNEATEQIFCIF